jgi:hypothetical protein
VNVPKINVEISLDSISRSIQLQGGVGFSPPPQIPSSVPWFGVYLWTVFFKIDGDTVYVDENLKVQGTAKLFPTPGNQGDLPLNFSLNSVAIPAANGYFRTALTPIPVNTLNMTVPGAMGCVAVVLLQNDTPADAIAQGHQALNDSLQQGLNSLISSLTIAHPTVTDDDVTALENQVSSAVKSAITNALSTWNKALTFLGLQNQDSMAGTVLYRFVPSDLTASPPAGIPLQNGFPDQSVIQVVGAEPLPRPLLITLTLTFQGSVVADPLPLSLRRILTRLDAVSVRKAMASTSIPFQAGSVNSWANAVT